MNYTLHQLEVFRMVTRMKSITKAAEALHLTQPAVSIQVRNFQEQFDIPLTEVVGRKLYVTDFGKEIAEASEKILDLVQAINLKTMAYKGHLTGRLKISVVSTGKYVIPYFLSDFLRANEGVELVLDVTNKQKVLESLEHNEVDFSLVSILPEQMSVEKLELMPNQLYPVVQGDLALPEGITLEQLMETLPLIYREPGSGTRLVTERFLQNRALEVRKKLELTSNEAVKQAVLARLGFSIMPEIGIRNELDQGMLRKIPMPGFPIVSTWHLIHLQRKTLSPIAQAFREYVANHKVEIIQRWFTT
jgi:LysR family transcriptional regulator, low CO2-responsive transcriptional regulator